MWYSVVISEGQKKNRRFSYKSEAHIGSKMREKFKFMVAVSRLDLKDTITGALKMLNPIYISSTTNPVIVEKKIKDDNVNLLILDHETLSQIDCSLLNNVKIILLASIDLSVDEMKSIYNIGINSILDYPIEIKKLEKAVNDAVRDVTVTKNRLQETFSEIKKVPFFDLLTKDELVRLLNTGKCRKYREGELVFLEGDEGDRLYVILEGKIGIIKQCTEDGRNLIISVLSKGECFGEMAVLDEPVRSATARAEEDVLLLEFEKKIISDDSDPISLKIFKKLAYILCKRLRKMDDSVKKCHISLEEHKRDNKRLKSELHRYLQRKTSA